jgi:hypothetical protein
MPITTIYEETVSYHRHGFIILNEYAQLNNMSRVVFDCGKRPGSSQGLRRGVGKNRLAVSLTCCY